LVTLHKKVFVALSEASKSVFEICCATSFSK
jgi:sarcosine oxidase gamma subunit